MKNNDGTVARIFGHIYEALLFGNLFIKIATEQQYEKAKEDSRRLQIYKLFMGNLDYVNNWDLVDSSCHKIAGPWLFERDRKPLYQLAEADHLWRNRIAIITINSPKTLNALRDEIIQGINESLLNLE